MRYRPTSYRFPSVMLDAVKRAADRDLRSVTKQIERYVREGLERDGIAVEDRRAD